MLIAGDFGGTKALLALFVAKVHIADRLSNTPVWVITTRAAPLGAAIYGLEHRGPA